MNGFWVPSESSLKGFWAPSESSLNEWVLGSLRELPEWVLGSLRELPEWSPGLGLHTCLLKEGWLSGWTDGLKEGDRAQITDSTGRSRGHGHKRTAGQAQQGLGG